MKNNRIANPCHLILFFIIIICFTGCRNIDSLFQQTSSMSSIQKSGIYFDTIITLTIYGTKDSSILDDCFSLCEKYENLLSRTIENSEISRLNNGEKKETFSMEVSQETANLLKKAMEYSKLSDGAFDFTIGTLTELWDFKAEFPSLPKQEQIKSALSYVNYKNFKLSGNTASFLKPGMKIDLGAIAKGYIADQLKNYLIEQGIQSALINLGGNILCVGSKPDGTPFQIGIQKPFEDRNETIASIPVRDQSVVSSGIYERYFTIDGKNYHHILNPKTGYPYDNDLISVTIISNQSVDGDALSTTCFSLGMKKGLNLIESLSDTYAIFITKDGNIHYSKGFLDSYSITKTN